MAMFYGAVSGNGYFALTRQPLSCCNRTQSRFSGKQRLGRGILYALSVTRCLASGLTTPTRLVRLAEIRTDIIVTFCHAYCHEASPSCASFSRIDLGYCQESDSETK